MGVQNDLRPKGVFMAGVQLGGALSLLVLVLLANGGHGVRGNECSSGGGVGGRDLCHAHSAKLLLYVGLLESSWRRDAAGHELARARTVSQGGGAIRKLSEPLHGPRRQRRNTILITRK